MKKTDFLVFAIVLFFLRFLVLPVLGWHTGIDFFAVFVLVLALADRNFEENFFLVFTAIVLFDLFSGNVFGAVSTALSLAVLLVFLAKKTLLASEQSRLFSFLIALFCYYVYVFFLFRAERLFSGFFSLFTLVIFIIIFIYAVMARQKRISGV